MNGRADRAAAAVLGGAGAVLLLVIVVRTIRGGLSTTGLFSPLTLVLAACALVAFIALQRGGMVRSVAAVAVVTGIMAAYAGEAALTFASGDAEQRAARRLGAPYDVRARWQLVDSLRALGVDAWPVMVPALAWGRITVRGHSVPWPDSVRPLAGIPGVVTVYCQETSGYTIYRSDALGYNNTGAPDTASPGGIAVLGDSFLHGACVPPDSGLVAQLRVLQPDARNFGQDGSGPLMELATLREVVAPLRPRLVVWPWYEGNDFGNLAAERGDPRLMAYLDPSHRVGAGPGDARVMRGWMDSLLVIARTSPRPGVLSRAAGSLALPRLRQARLDRRPEVPPPDSDVALLGRVLQAARAEAASWGGRVVVAYLPAWHRYFAPDQLQFRRPEVLAAAREAGLLVVDLEPAFAGHPDKTSLFGYGGQLRGHYSGQGYRLAAQTLARGLDSVTTRPSLERPPDDR